MTEEKKEGLNEGEETSTGADQPENETPEEEEVNTSETEETGEPEEKSEEDVESIEERLAKAERDRDNYKKALLSKKLKNRKLETDTEEETSEVEDNEETWDEDSKKFQSETLSKAEKVAQVAAQKALEARNEKDAIADFVAENPEYADDSNWNQLLKNLPGSIDKGSVKEVKLALEKADLLTKYEKGELSEDRMYKKGVNDGVIKSKTSEANSLSKRGGKASQKTTPKVSAGALEMAKNMRVNEDQLSKEDDTDTAEIEI